MYPPLTNVSTYIYLYLHIQYRNNYKQTGSPGEEGMDMVCVTDHLDEFTGGSSSSSSSSGGGSSSSNGSSKKEEDKKELVDNSSSSNAVNSSSSSSSSSTVDSMSTPVDDRKSTTTTPPAPTPTPTPPITATTTTSTPALAQQMPAMKMGTLKKDGHGMITSWKSRHFVLLEGRLSYYEDSSFNYPYGVGEKGHSELASMTISQLDSVAQSRMRLEHVTDKKVCSDIIMYIRNDKK
jgi:hypothetical protein